MPNWKCCVPECDYVTGTVKHRFPVYEEHVFREWVKRVGCEKLKNLDDQTIYKNFFVCTKHFSDDCKSPGTKRLNRGSLPTLHLKGFTDGEASYSEDLNVNNAGLRQQVPSTSESIHLQEIGHATENTMNMQTAHKRSYEEALGENDQCTPVPVKVKRGLLQTVSTHRSCELTQKAKKLYQSAKKFKRKVSALSRKCLSFKQRLTTAEKCSNSKFFKDSLSKLNPMARAFIQCQITNRGKHPKGRRFTTKQKILSLSIFKQAGKSYRLLSKIFTLPSKTSLMKMLKKVLFQSGMNSKIFTHLRRAVTQMRPRDKYCTLVFDEMSISCGLQYNAAEDKILGFSDVGREQLKPVFADHALVFMARGVHRKWKQPISYFFVQGTIGTIDLVRIIKEMLRALMAVGLKVVATVCDQGTTNVAAINYLLEETRQTCLREQRENKYVGFVLDDWEIIPLYDPPHLLKGIRNNLLTKDLMFFSSGKWKTAKWQHVIQLFFLDREVEDDFKIVPKLTNEHVLPDKIKKMKVKNCSQVFSQRVSAIMRRLAQWSSEATQGALEPEAEDTADLLLLMDKVFDSVNGSSVLPKNGKTLRCAVTKTSEHIQFWDSAIKILSSMKFISPVTKSTSVPPALKNWILTLKNFQHLSKKLMNAGFRYICLRNFNQDPVENFFACIRSHGARNTNPTSASFAAAFRSLIITNFMSSHTASANCEDDMAEGALDTLQDFIYNTDGSDIADEPVAYSVVASTSVPATKDLTTPRSRMSEATAVYVNGYVARKVFQATRYCSTCRDKLMSVTTEANCEFITARQYSPKALCCPSTNFNKVCNAIVSIVHKELPLHCHKSNVAKELQICVIENVDFSSVTCVTHNIQDLTLGLLLKVMIFAWVKKINRVLTGRESLRNSVDPIKIQAQKYYNTHCKKTFRK